MHNPLLAAVDGCQTKQELLLSDFVPLCQCAAGKNHKVQPSLRSGRVFFCCCFSFSFFSICFFFLGVKILSTPTYWKLAFLLAWQMCRGREKKKKKALFLQALYTIHSNTVHINKQNTSPRTPRGVREKGENKTSTKTHRLSVFHTTILSTTTRLLWWRGHQMYCEYMSSW